MKNIKKSGFTLIELLVVVAIIGILASVVLSSLSEARKRARDAKRIAMARQIETALELYYLDNNEYPPTPSSYGETSAGGWDHSNIDVDSDGIYFLDPLVEGEYLPLGSYDSIFYNETGYVDSSFIYYKYPESSATSLNCATTKPFYVIEVFLESTPGKTAHQGSPGFSCPGRNWQPEANYVFGKFEI